MSADPTVDAGAPYTRGELEIELGRLALALGRVQATHRGRGHRVAGGAAPAVDVFLDACSRLLSRARGRHRDLVVERLCYLAASADLGLIGLEEWLREQACPHSTSDRRLAVGVRWQGRDGDLQSSGRL